MHRLCDYLVYFSSDAYHFVLKKAVRFFVFLLFSRDFSGNQLACDCNVYSSFVSVISALWSGGAAQCVSPPRVASVQFFSGGSYKNHPVQDFTCCMYKICRDCMSNIIQAISHTELNHVTMLFLLVNRVWDLLHLTKIM